MSKWLFGEINLVIKTESCLKLFKIVGVEFREKHLKYSYRTKQQIRSASHELSLVSHVITDSQQGDKK